MANALNPFLCQTRHPDADLVAFRFQVTDPAGTADPDFVFPGNQGVSDVVRVSEGVYDITLDFKYPFMLAAFCGVEGSAADTDGIAGKVVSYTASTGKLRVTTYAPAITDVPTAKDPLEDSWVHVIAVMARKTSVHAVAAI